MLNPNSMLQNVVGTILVVLAHYFRSVAEGAERPRRGLLLNIHLEVSSLLLLQKSRFMHVLEHTSWCLVRPVATKVAGETPSENTQFRCS